MSEPRTRHRLIGLEPDNLLAFLALLGLLRSLELTRPNWIPKTYWDFTSLPRRPVLTIHESITEDMICTAAIGGLTLFRKALHPFRWQCSKNGKLQKRATLVTTPDRQRSLARRCILALQSCKSNAESHLVWQLRCDLIACSGATNTGKDNEIASTPLKLPSGKMAFIGAMFDLVEQCTAEDIKRSLFHKWTYSYKGNSLRLSPDEAQRYAYRASDPSPEGAFTEKGASALASLGLLSFPMVDTQSYWKMPAYSGNRREGRISWPIWRPDSGNGSSLCAIKAMLQALPVNRTDSKNLFGPEPMIAIARRYVLDPTQGDYGNISRARIEPISEQRE